MVSELTRWTLALATHDRYFKTGVPVVGDIQDSLMKLSKKEVTFMTDLGIKVLDLTLYKDTININIPFLMTIQDKRKERY